MKDAVVAPRAPLSQVARHSQESGARSYLVVRGLSAIADELQVASPLFVEAARFLPDLAAPARERAVPPTSVTATGPILTSHEVMPEAAAPVEADATVEAQSAPRKNRMPNPSRTRSF